MRSLALACVSALTPLALCAGAQASPAAIATPKLPLGHSGRWITDARGRVVIVHGVNMVYKIAPYYPSATGFGDDDAAFLAAVGFNAVRVGVIWKAVEPEPGVYDDAYLNQIAATVKTLARHGIVSLLDFHQDMYNELFQGEGAPDWAVEDDGLPRVPQTGFPGNSWTCPRFSTHSTTSGPTAPARGVSVSRTATAARGVTSRSGSAAIVRCWATSCSTSRSRGRHTPPAWRQTAAPRSTPR